MTRKRKHPELLPDGALAPPAPSKTTALDYDSDSPLGSPDSCGASGGSCSPGSGGGKPGEKPPLIRSAANARERTRMRVLSKAFSRLKTTLPWVPADTKLSKLDTLRLASCYIAHLREILADDTGPKAAKPATGGKAAGPGGAQAPIHPLSLTWPFTFNGRVSLSSTSLSATSDAMTSRQKDAVHPPPNKSAITS